MSIDSREFDNIILVTGAARSGTSMVAGSIHLCGAFGGNMSGPNRWNEKGMFENAHIRQHIVKPYLESISADKLGQYPLPDVNSLPIPTDWRRRVEQVLIDQGYNSGPVFYKGAKMCLIWPVWHYAFPKAKWVIVRRSTTDIINSCVKTSFMSAFVRKENQRKVGANDEREGWKWWVDQHLARFREMMDAGLNIKVVLTEPMIQGNYEQLYQLIECLGLKWNSEVLSFIDPKLWRARRR